jgi:hypothetical protein
MQTPCPSIGIFKSFRAKPSSTTLKPLTSIRWCWGTKPQWLLPHVKWYPCWLFILHSKLTSLKWNKCSRLTIKRGTKFFMFHLSIGKGRMNSKNNTCLLGIDIRCLRMRDLSLSCLPILTLNCFQTHFFCVGWEL